MGSIEGSNSETPQHTVILSEYRIGRYPVTIAEFNAYENVKYAESSKHLDDVYTLPKDRDDKGEYPV